MDDISYNSVCVLNDNRCVAVLYEDTDGRNLNLNWFDNDWNDNCRFGAVRKSLHFSPNYLGEFCFVSCPFHPPSIFPISSIFSERKAYFLVSNDFVSHKIIRNILSVSFFLIANLTQGCFSWGDKKLAIAIASIISVNNLSIFNPREYL